MAAARNILHEELCDPRTANLFKKVDWKVMMMMMKGWENSVISSVEYCLFATDDRGRGMEKEPQSINLLLIWVRHVKEF